MSCSRTCRAAFSLSSALALAACFSLDVKPDKLVSDTADAGKRLYRSYKAGGEGKAEREFALDLPVEAGQTREAAAAGCLEQLRRQAAQAAGAQASQRGTEKGEAPKGEAEILSEATKHYADEKGQWVRCSIKAMI